MQQLILYAAINSEGDIALYSAKPRYEKSINSFVCSRGEIILKRNLRYKKLINFIESSQIGDEAVEIQVNLILGRIPQ